MGEVGGVSDGLALAPAVVGIAVGVGTQLVSAFAGVGASAVIGALCRGGAAWRIGVGGQGEDAVGVHCVKGGVAEAVGVVGAVGGVGGVPAPALVPAAVATAVDAGTQLVSVSAGVGASAVTSTLRRRHLLRTPHARRPRLPRGRRRRGAGSWGRCWRPGRWRGRRARRRWRRSGGVRWRRGGGGVSDASVLVARCIRRRGGVRGDRRAAPWSRRPACCPRLRRHLPVRNCARLSQRPGCVAGVGDQGEGAVGGYCGEGGVAEVVGGVSAVGGTAATARRCECRCPRLLPSPLTPARSWPARPPAGGVRGDRRAARWLRRLACWQVRQVFRARLRRDRPSALPPHDDHSDRVGVGGDSGLALWPGPRRCRRPGRRRGRRGTASRAA